MENIVENKQWNEIFNLMLDHSVSEVEVNAPDGVFVKQSGKRIRKENIFFLSEEDYANSIKEAVVPLVSGVNGEAYNPFGSIFEGRLLFERAGIVVQARCHIMLPPVCDYPQITLAKRSKTLNTVDSLAGMGSMSTEMLHFLEMCADANLTIVFSGQSGAGKDLSENTPIPTPHGFVPLKDIKIGDNVYNEKGEVCEVTNKYAPARDRKYVLNFSNGEKIVAGEGHVWNVLDLNDSSVKDSLWGVKIPLSPKNVSRLEVATLGEDKYVSVEDFLKEIEYTSPAESNGIKHLDDGIVEHVKRFAYNASDLFAMTTRSVLDSKKVEFINHPEVYGEVEKKLRAWDREEISFSELFALCDNENIYRALTPSIGLESMRVVSRREVANSLLEEHRRRLAIRQEQDKENRKKAHSFRRNLTTQEMFENMNAARIAASEAQSRKELESSGTVFDSIKNSVYDIVKDSSFIKNVSDDGDTGVIVDTEDVKDREYVSFAVERVQNSVDIDTRTDLPFSPYIVGLWIGSVNGSDGRIITEGSLEDLEEIKAKIVSGGTPEKKVKIVFKHSDPATGAGVYTLRVSGFKQFVKSYGRKNESGSVDKDIPADYIFASSRQRTELVGGIIDGGGSVSHDGRGTCSFVSTSRELVESLRSVVSSLGLRTSPIRITPRSTEKDGETVALSDGFGIQFFFNASPFGLNRNIEAMQERLTNLRRLGGQVEHSKVYITSIEPYTPHENEKFYCLEVDTPSHLFLCGETFIPTHNTTMLEALTKHIPGHYRIGVAEDTPELNLIQENVTYLHSVPWAPGMDEKDVATLQWVVSQFQRNRCDKLIIGETRGKEFGDFLIAANSGMEGSMTTIHANDPAQCLTKMSNFAMKAADKQPIRAINNDIASAVDIIVQLVVIDGKHRMSHITEVVPTLGNTEEAKITISDLYRWDRLADKFYKAGPLSDNLRRILDERGVDYEEFLSSPKGRENSVSHHQVKGNPGINFGSDAKVKGFAVGGGASSEKKKVRTIDSAGIRESSPDKKNESRRRGLPKRRFI